jgi:hypothetical protein
MIAAIPVRVLKLVTERADDPVPDVPSRDDMLQTLVAQAKAQGYSHDFIVDAIDRRIRAYIAKVGQRGEGERNATAYRIAVWLLNDFGAKEATAVAYIAEWNSANCPPLSERELKAVIASAKRSHRRPAGCAHQGSAA